MRYLNVKVFNINLHLLVIYLLILLLSSCKGGHNKQFYGTYEYVDSNNFAFSKITFYENNQYSFYRSNCFFQGNDSGNFSLTNGTISFHSFDLPLLDTNDRADKNLNKVNFMNKVQ